MRTSFILLLIVAILSSCSEDEPFQDSSSSTSLEGTIIESRLPESYGVFDVQVGNHPLFEERNDNKPILVLFDAPDSAFDFQLFATDSLRFQDSLLAYTRIAENQEPERDGVFRSFQMRNRTRDGYLRVAYRVGDSLRISDAITLRSGSLTTSDVDEILIEESEDQLFFNWEDITATDLYLVSIRDPFGDVVAAFYTYRNFFQFYDLRFATRNLMRQTASPRLTPSSRYKLEVIAISRRGWMNAYGELNFTVENER